MKSFLFGIVVTIGGLYYAHQTYGTLQPCDMLAKERAADSTGGSDGLLGLAAEVWQSHRTDEMNIVQCTIELGGEWVANAKELIGLDE